MIHEEWGRASLFKVIEKTLDEYVESCESMRYRVDKCGYIHQILDKVEQRSEAKR